MIDRVIPQARVLVEARKFLAECGWELEIGDSRVEIPVNTELRVQTRAYVVADAPDVLLGNHYEAVVLLGCEKVGENWRPQFGYLKMYFDERGNFVTEDRYARHVS